MNHTENCKAFHLTCLAIMADLRINYLPSETWRYIAVKESPCHECCAWCEEHESTVTSRLYSQLLEERWKLRVEPHVQAYKVIDIFNNN